MSAEQSDLQGIAFEETGVTQGLQSRGILIMQTLALSSSPRASRVDEFQEHIEQPLGFRQNYNVSQVYSLPSLFFLRRDQLVFIGGLKSLP